MKSKSTIYDISKLAKVSIATVSRVVNNDDSVRESTRQKVLGGDEYIAISPLSIGKVHGGKKG